MLNKTWLVILIIILISLFFFLYSSPFSGEEQTGTLSIYYRGEGVGSEHYVWESNQIGYTLRVEGQIHKPVPVEIDQLCVELSKNFIPRRFYFKGSVSGVEKEIKSVITDGYVENSVFIHGQEQRETTHIKRDALLLPNPVFSPYMVLAKKYSCSLHQKIETQAYIIPQTETKITIKPAKKDPCTLVVKMNQTQIKIKTNPQGSLISIGIPSQYLKVIHSSLETSRP